MKAALGAIADSSYAGNQPADPLGEAKFDSTNSDHPAVPRIYNPKAHVLVLEVRRVLEACQTRVEENFSAAQNCVPVRHFKPAPVPHRDEVSDSGREAAKQRRYRGVNLQRDANADEPRVVSDRKF